MRFDAVDRHEFQLHAKALGHVRGQRRFDPDDLAGRRTESERGIVRLHADDQRAALLDRGEVVSVRPLPRPGRARRRPSGRRPAKAGLLSRVSCCAPWQDCAAEGSIRISNRRHVPRRESTPFCEACAVAVVFGEAWVVGRRSAPLTARGLGLPTATRLLGPRLSHAGGTVPRPGACRNWHGNCGRNG